MMTIIFFKFIICLEINTFSAVGKEAIQMLRTTMACTKCDVGLGIKISKAYQLNAFLKKCL